MTLRPMAKSTELQLWPMISEWEPPSYCRYLPRPSAPKVSKMDAAQEWCVSSASPGPLPHHGTRTRGHTDTPVLADSVQRARPAVLAVEAVAHLGVA
jgi:hypothetical protein